MRALLASLVVLTVMVSGCLGAWDKRPDYDATAAEVEGTYLELVEGDSNVTALNTRLIAHHNGVDDSGNLSAIPTGGYYTEIDVQDGLVYLARGSAPGDGRGGFGGFSIIDIQDPKRPTFVGAYEAPTGSDIEVNQDGTLAFFGTQRNTVEEIAGRLESTQDPQAAAPRGIHVVDITQKDAPTQVNFLPLPVNGVHTITYHAHQDGNEYLIVCTYDFASNTVASDDAPPLPLAIPGVPDPNPATQRVIIYQIMDDEGRVILPVGQYQSTEPAPSGKLFFPHDTWVEPHPLFPEKTLMYVAYWDQGVHIVDISDPTQPVLMDSHRDFSPSTRGNVHFTRPLDTMVGGRHITVTEPEIISADETGYFFLLDTTDPSDIQRAGPEAYWTLPGDRIVTDLDYSPHNFDVRNGVIALAHNMAGVWFVDVSDLENVRDPKTTGYYLADMERADTPRPIPWSWGVRWLDDTTVLVSDEGSGLHIIEYTAPTFP